MYVAHRRPCRRLLRPCSNTRRRVRLSLPCADRASRCAPLCVRVEIYRILFGILIIMAEARLTALLKWFSFLTYFVGLGRASRLTQCARTPQCERRLTPACHALLSLLSL